MSEDTHSTASTASDAARQADHEDDAVYQNGKIAARVLGAEVRADNREVHFAEINNCDDLMLPEECEFQKYRLMIQRIEYASRIDKTAPEKGRVLRGVVAEVLGYREQ